MKRAIILFLILTLNFTTYSQIKSKFWYFGENAGIDFNTDPPSKVLNHKHNLFEGGVCITDEFGDLVLFIDNKTVYNRFNMPILNGNNLIGNNGSSAQSPIAVQLPSNKDLIYIFYISDHLNPSTTGQFRYSIIDLCGNDGIGEIKAENKNILIPGEFTERLELVFDSQKKSYWILTCDKNKFEIKAFKLDANGLDPKPVTSTLNEDSYPSFIGMIRINYSKNKIALSCGLSGNFRGLFICDFNLNSGKITNEKKIFIGDTYGLQFTPNDNYLFFTNIFGLCSINKIDLNTNQISTFLTINKHYTIGNILIGPDFNIYVSISGYNSVGRIKSPNYNLADFDPKFLEYPDENIITLGLQSSNSFFGIISDTIKNMKLPKDTFICNENAIILDSGNENTIWNKNKKSRYLFVNNPGKFWYEYRICNILFTDTINVIKRKKIKINRFNIDNCETEIVILTPTVAGAKWNDNQTGPIKVKNGIFVAIYSDSCFTNIDSFYVKLNSKLEIQRLATDTIICKNESFILKLPPNFSLIFHKDTIIGSNLPLVESGDYILYAKNKCNEVKLKMKLKFDSNPNQISPIIEVCNKDLPFILDTGVENTTWNNTTFDRKIIVNEVGKYFYSLSNACGNFNETISISKKIDITLPNVFSPNSDGYNDLFPGNPILNGFNLKIFDRWGNKVFDDNSDWDGKDNDRKCTTGIYTYIFEMKTCASDFIYGSVLVID
jgi:gliding motility-associated-like protein